MKATRVAIVAAVASVLYGLSSSPAWRGAGWVLSAAVLLPLMWLLGVSPADVEKLLQERRK